MITTLGKNLPILSWILNNNSSWVESTIPSNNKEALSILEKLHVPDGWCSSGFKANEYT